MLPLLLEMVPAIAVDAYENRKYLNVIACVLCRSNERYVQATVGVPVAITEPTLLSKILVKTAGW